MRADRSCRFWGLFAVLLIVTGCGRDGSGPYPLLDFQVEFGENDIPAQMTAGQTVKANVTVKNTSKNTWPSKADEKGHKIVNLSYHWLDSRGNMVVFDGLRTALPHDVGPGESVRLDASIQAPDGTGRYTLEVTLVQEAVAWFPDMDGDKLTLPVRVVRGPSEKSPLPSAEPRVARSAPVAPKVSVEHKSPARPMRDEQKIKNLPVKREARKAELTDPNKAVQKQGSDGQLWTVQVAAFPTRQEAEGLAKKLQGENYDTYITVFQIKGKDWHRVRVGRLASRTDAEKLQKTLRENKNFQQAFVTTLQ